MVPVALRVTRHGLLSGRHEVARGGVWLTSCRFAPPTVLYIFDYALYFIRDGFSPCAVSFCFTSLLFIGSQYVFHISACGLLSWCFVMASAVCAVGVDTLAVGRLQLLELGCVN